MRKEVAMGAILKCVGWFGALLMGIWMTNLPADLRGSMVMPIVALMLFGIGPTVAALVLPNRESNQKNHTAAIKHTNGMAWFAGLMAVCVGTMVVFTTTSPIR
jgi:hypothetical protein